MIKVLFVCLGNICRSPMAEFIFKDIVKKRGLEEQFFIDSAATSGYNERYKECMYIDAQDVLRKYNVPFTEHISRQIRKEDYDIRESNIIKICHGMQIEPFDLFQTSEEILVLEKDEEIQAILEARSLPEEYREIMLEYLHSLKRIAERSK